MGLFESPRRLDDIYREEPLIQDLSHLDVAGKKVFLRCDLNVPDRKSTRLNSSHT